MKVTLPRLETDLTQPRPVIILGYPAGNGDCYIIDPAAVRADTDPCYWVSGPLNTGPQAGKQFTLHQFFLEYVSNEGSGSITLNFSPDGGNTWGSNYSISVIDTGGAVEIAQVSPLVTGMDLRVKITLPFLMTLRVTAFEPRITVRKILA